MRIWHKVWAFFKKRATFKDTEGWFHDWLLGGSATASGQAVGPNTALTLSSYFASVRAVAEDVGKIPLILYRRSGQGKDRATSHPLYRLLHDQPNPDMTAMDFRSCMTANAANWGSAYAEIVRNRAGQALAWWPLESGKMSIERDANGKLIYIYRDGGVETRLPQRDVFHLRGLASNGIEGYSIARLARESIGLGLAEQKSGGAFFGNANRPSGILESPQPLEVGQKDELRKQWEAQHKGSENAHKTAVLSGGITFKPLSISNEDAQFIESRQLTVEEMARWLRVPPHVIGHLLRATFSNIEHLAIEYVTHCLMSWAVRWEQEIQRKLISPRERNVFAEHLFDALLRGDIETRYKAYATARRYGLASANDILRRENMNPIGPAGDVYMVEGNMINVERLLEKEEPNGLDTGNGGETARPNDTEEAPEGEGEKKDGRSLAMSESLRDRFGIEMSGRDGNGSGQTHGPGGRD